MDNETNDLGRVVSDEQALVNEAPTGLHLSGFDPSRVRFVYARDMIKEAIVSFKRQYKAKAGAAMYNNAGQTYGDAFAALDALDANSCSREAVDLIIGNASWTHNNCDLCHRHVAVLVRLGDEPDYDARWQDVCPDCIVRLAQGMETGTAETLAAPGEA